MKKMILASFIFLMSLSTYAYDVDTHFYATYAMARHAGIKKEVAAKIATSTQWMDESYISDPTSMLFLAATGVHKRRLLHFPSERIGGDITSETQTQSLGLNVKISQALLDVGNTFLKLIKINPHDLKIVKQLGIEVGDKLTSDDIDNILLLKTKTTEANLFATEMLTEGLKDGNLMKAATGLHTLEDSFAHAGTPAEEGHINFWHWPDRPYDDVDKYFRMVRSVMRAMVAIRESLPKEALDCSRGSSCTDSADVLSKSYSENENIRSTVSYNMLTDPDYVQTALNHTIDKAVKKHYLNLLDDDRKTVTDLINDVTFFADRDNAQSAYKSMEFIINSLAKIDSSRAESQRIINIPVAFTRMGLTDVDLVLTPAVLINYISNYDNAGYEEGLKQFIFRMTEFLLRSDVPSPLTKSNRGEIEDDTSPVRAKEMELRIANMRRLVEDLYGEKIVFLENESKDVDGFRKEMSMDESAELDVNQSLRKIEKDTREKIGKDVTKISFNLREKNAFDRMIVKFLSPNQSEEGVSALIRFAFDTGAIGKSKDVPSDETKDQLNRIYDFGFYTRGLKYVGFKDGKKWPFASTQYEVSKQYILDLLNEHLVPNIDNMAYNREARAAELRNKGIFKPTMSASTRKTWVLNGGQVVFDPQGQSNQLP